MSRNRNWTHITAVVIVHMFMLGAAAISFGHLVELSHILGLRWEAYTVPFFVDGLAILGKMGRSARFAESTQRAGLMLMSGAGVLSLACNVMAGANHGQQLYGALVVAGFVTTEWYSSKLRPAAADTPKATGRKLDPAVAAERARKAAVTREANRLKGLTPAQKGALTRKAKRVDDAELAQVLAGTYPADAPVSPGMA